MVEFEVFMMKRVGNVEEERRAATQLKGEAVAYKTKEHIAK